MRALLAGVVIGVLVGGAVVGSASYAQPAPDLERAKALYKAAEQAMQDGRYQDAIRDYDATFELTHDPVLFYKIGGANERAGKCDVALIYYGRYLREAKGTDAFAEQTRVRIKACGGDDRTLGRPATAAPGDTTSAPGSTDTTPPQAGSATSPAPADAGSAAAPLAETPGPGSAAAPTTTLKPLPGRNRAAWLLVASSVAFATVGGVLAYSANSAENDISDLYVGLNDVPPAFDPRLQQTYDDLIAEGERYETLSWVSFGLAGASAIAAGVLFWRAPERVQITPTASPGSAGVSVGGRF